MTTNQEKLIIGLPLSPGMQVELIKRLKRAYDAGHDEIVACHDQVTGFAVAAHIANGLAFFFEMVGPITGKQADAWAAGLNTLDDEPVKVIN